jgi:hypothetical protein
MGAYFTFFLKVQTLIFNNKMKHCFIWAVKVNTDFHGLKLSKYNFKYISLFRIYNLFLLSNIWFKILKHIIAIHRSKFRISSVMSKIS